MDHGSGIVYCAGEAKDVDGEVERACHVSESAPTGTPMVGLGSEIYPIRSLGPTRTPNKSVVRWRPQPEKIPYVSSRSILLRWVVKGRRRLWSRHGPDISVSGGPDAILDWSGRPRGGDQNRSELSKIIAVKLIYEVQICL